MSAETLRKAASLMRERAEAATDGPWYAAPHGSRKDCRCVKTRGAGRGRDYGEFVAMYVTRDAEHIASWHPAVALAVADWLDATARELDSLGDPDLSRHPLDGRRTAGLAVARAYLGSES